MPRYSGGRVSITTWLLASLVFMSSYSGILTAMLTFPRVTIPIDSIYDLVAQQKMPWKIEGGSMLYQYFQVKLLTQLKRQGAHLNQPVISNYIKIDKFN